jgi:hypothetical protein
VTIRRVFLGAVAVLVSHGAINAAEQCPAPYTGRFENPEYGYAFVVPHGLVGYWQSPCTSEPDGQCTCMGVHGLYMPLSRAAVLSVYSGYAAWMEDDTSEKAVVASVIDLQRKNAKHLAITISTPHKVLLKGRTGFRYEEAYRDADSNTEMQSINYVFVSHGAGLIELELSMTAPKALFNTYLRQFDEVLKSVEWLPNNH